MWPVQEIYFQLYEFLTFNRSKIFWYSEEYLSKERYEVCESHQILLYFAQIVSNFVELHSIDLEIVFEYRRYTERQ